MSETRKPSVRTVESLGKLVYETKPNMSNLVAGFILSAALVAGGLGLMAYMTRQIFFAGGQRGFEWGALALLLLIGPALCVGGVLLFLYVRSLLGFRLRVCAEGFWFTRRNQDTVFAWDEIVQVRETVLHERLPIVKGPARKLAPQQTSRNYRVVRCDGLEFYFDGNVMPRTSLLAGPLASAAKKRGIDWTTVEQNN